MVIVQKRSKRKPTGGRFKILYRSKRLFETGRRPTLSLLGNRFLKIFRLKGGGEKQKLLRVEKANVFDPKIKKHKVVAITTIKENGANRNYVRRNIMTKGTVIETESGLARITSRPGQTGTVNAVLL